MENIIRALESEIAAKERDVEKLRRMLNEARDNGNYVSTIHAEAVRPSKNQFAGTPSGIAIRQYLDMAGGSEHLDKIRVALLEGGCNLGMYPKRTVKLAVVNSPKTFEVKGDKDNPLVSLKR